MNNWDSQQWYWELLSQEETSLKMQKKVDRYGGCNWQARGAGLYEALFYGPPKTTEVHNMKGE